jgi:hypothetical protein
MPTEEPQDIDEVLDRVLRDQPLGEQPEGHSEEIELHKPLMRQRAEPRRSTRRRTPRSGSAWAEKVCRNPGGTALTVAIGERARADHGTTTEQDRDHGKP